VERMRKEREEVLGEVLEEKKRNAREREREFRRWEERVVRVRDIGRWGRVKNWWKRKRGKV